jgi:hypothetical protein
VTSDVVDAAPSVGDPPAPTPTGAADPEYVLVNYEARRRGFRNSLALRRFCLRARVSFTKIGKMLFVRPRDLDEAIARGGSPRRDEPSSNIAHALDVLKHRR